MTFKTPLDVRLACRSNELAGFASKALPGYLCVNVAFLDVDYANDFEAFCRANPKPCPLIARMAPGQTDCPEFASDLDIRTDLGSYDIVRHGEVSELRKEIVDLFDDRMVTFLIGSSVSFDGLLAEKAIQLLLARLFSSLRSRASPSDLLRAIWPSPFVHSHPI